MSGVFGRPVPPTLEEPMQHAERLCAALACFEARGPSDTARAWLIGRREEIEKVLSLVVDDWGAKRRTDGQARASVIEYLAELHGAAARLFGLEAVARDCCFGDVVATEPIHLEDTTREVEVSGLAFFPSGDTVADPQAVTRSLKSKA